MSRSRSASRSRSGSIQDVDMDRSQGALDPDACPFLIRIFINKGHHTPMADFEAGKLPVRDEWQVYGWRTSTPSSLIRLMYPTFPTNWRSPQARYSFRHIYVDASSRGLYRHRDLITFSGRDILTSSLPSKSSMKADGGDIDMDDKMNRPLSDEVYGREKGVKSRVLEEEKTLDDYGFVTGDYLSVSLHVPEPRSTRQTGPGVGGNRELMGGTGKSYGWNERVKDKENDRGSGGTRVAAGNWARGQPLPPVSTSRRGEIAGGGNWRGGAPGGRGAPAFGIRGSGRRGSPDRDRDIDREKERREKSPEVRDKREKWANRGRE